MKLSKNLSVRIFLILLGVSSLYIAHRDSEDGEATRRGLDVKKTENPILFATQIIQKNIFGVIFIGVGLFLRGKKDNDE
jgi:hypothetical protein